MTDEKGNFWTLAELLTDLDGGENLYLTPKMCADLAALLRANLPAPEASPLSRSLKSLEGLNIRRVLEESNLPVEIATAIADRLERPACKKCDAPHCYCDRSRSAKCLQDPSTDSLTPQKGST
jgi:hypothetical protein